MTTLVWFRSDLRVADHPALAAAGRRGPVAAAFLVATDQWREHDWAPVRVEFVRRTLAVLRADLEERGIPLLIRSAPRFADAPKTLVKLAQEVGADAIFFNEELEVNERRRDEAVAAAAEKAGITVQSFLDQTVLPPDLPRTGSDGFYSVFTPFRKKWLSLVADQGGPPRPEYRPREQDRIPKVRSDSVPDRFGDADVPDAIEHWPAGEDEARRRLDNFLASRAAEYDERRDFPDVDGTSQLSPYLAVGAISVRQCLRLAWSANEERLDGGTSGLDTWITELIWREFYRHVLVGYPRVSMHLPFRMDTTRIRWRDDDDAVEAWRNGRTGFPIVDAAMRQLRGLGWMHNRLRMVTAMFFSKDLLVDWRVGERHFMSHLIDGDLASNNGGWQWSASTGTDAAPYFRIFNPTSQSKRFDKDGAFIREWVPELADVKGKAIHDPPKDVRKACEYPEPVVDHAQARERAIAAFKD